MIPIRDTIRSSSFPVVNWLIIAANTLVFVYETSLNDQALIRLSQTFGMVPANLHLTNPSVLLNHPWVLLTLVTSQFLHGGWFHLISNMWVLFIFGDNVEDRMGSGRYLIFYLLGGIVANLTEAFVLPTSQVPAIGASGAIAGVLGGYFLLFPRAKVTTLMLIFIIPWFVEISAFIFLGFWFISQIYSGLFSLGQSAALGGVAWWAHIGGFLFGLLFVRLFSAHRHPATYRRYPDEYWPW